jgi:ABC-2 type transport system ATP-binding protein
MEEVLRQFGGGDCPKHHDASVAVRLENGDAGLADVVRALDARDIGIAHLQLHEPTLDDVFLAKTGHSLEGAGDDVDEPAPV